MRENAALEEVELEAAAAEIENQPRLDCFAERPRRDTS
jgi:hypothetical protein